MIIINSIEDMEQYYQKETNTYVFKEDIICTSITGREENARHIEIKGGA